MSMNPTTRSSGEMPLDDSRNAESFSEPSRMGQCKRAFDVSVTLVVLLVLSPLLLLIALTIKLASPGPVLFKQERVGLQGRRFTCYKFRSMRVGNDDGEHRQHLAALMASHRPMTKLDQHQDPRTSPLGRLLRASGLDELPQLVNVVKGDMSLVGPRPCIPYEYAGYTNGQKLRFLSTPGLTGLWQVSGKNRTTFDEMVALDIDYAFCRSLSLDLRILLRTPGVVHGQLREWASADLAPAPAAPVGLDTRAHG